MVRANDTRGAITVTASAAGLKPGTAAFIAQ
jgi:hypothetical protein